MKKGRCGTMTHDYKRNGTTTLFAALNVLDGTVIGRCMQRHRHGEFIRFLNVTEAAVPSSKAIHAIVAALCSTRHRLDSLPNSDDVRLMFSSLDALSWPSTSCFPRPPARSARQR
jgi:hypothetical protein